MATWGEFMSEIHVVRMKPGGMYVQVDEVITLWEERNNLRAEVDRLRAELAGEREACAQEVEEFAQACAEESDQAEFIARALQIAAMLIRERGEPDAETEAEPVATAEEPSEPAAAPSDGAEPRLTEQEP